ncbi:MAG: hypothetical protein OEW15_13905 [Nitrospirota bacterium]|nr:hypothetical protein [Nitrospirota bacterium]
MAKNQAFTHTPVKIRGERRLKLIADDPARRHIHAAHQRPLAVTACAVSASRATAGPRGSSRSAGGRTGTYAGIQPAIAETGYAAGKSVHQRPFENVTAIAAKVRIAPEPWASPADRFESKIKS